MNGDDLDLHGLPEPPAAAYAAVRERVMARIRRRRRIRWAVGAIAAVAACVALAVWRPVEPAPVRPPMLAQAPQPPVLAAAVTPSRTLHATRSRRPERPLHPPHNGEPLLVRLETNDPNVVILWEVN